MQQLVSSGNHVSEESQLHATQQRNKIQTVTRNVGYNELSVQPEVNFTQPPSKNLCALSQKPTFSRPNGFFLYNP